MVLSAGASTYTLASDIEYAPFGGITSLRYGHDKVLSQAYDTAYRLTTQILPGILDLTYERYDANGNLMTRTDRSGKRTGDYSYDALDRLKTDLSPLGTRAYVYDKNGNRTRSTINDVQANYRYEAASNRMQHYNTETVPHDENGNILTLRNLDLNPDPYNRLVNANGNVYRYNGLGQRVAKYPNADMSRYVYDLNGQLIGEYTATGDFKREYIYLNGQPLAMIDDTNLYYIHNDHLGTPQKLSDPTGTVVWSATYDPFGQAFIDTDPDSDGQQVTFNLRLPGQYYDSETGLHYNYFRYYDPQTGRYITSDPIGLQGGLNTYGYVSGNPLRFIDQFGLDIKLGSGYTGRIDNFEFKGSASFEIHVYDPKGVEVGVHGPQGWIPKHGHSGNAPNLPDNVTNSIHGNVIDQLRGMGVIPKKGTANIKNGKWEEFAKGTRKACKVLGPLSIPITIGISYGLGEDINGGSLLCDAVWGCNDLQ